MGAGDFTAGDDGGTGEDPIPHPLPNPIAARFVVPPDALLFDGVSRDFPLQANGLYAGIHPVDQEVALELLIALGSLAAVPELGNGVRNIKKITSRTPAEAENAIRTAVKDLVNAKKIALIGIQIETNRLGGSVAAVISYRNLRLNKNQKVRVPVLNAP